MKAGLMQAKVRETSISSLCKRMEKATQHDLKAIHTKLMQGKEIWDRWNYVNNRHTPEAWERLIKVFEAHDAPEWKKLKQLQKELKEFWNVNLSNRSQKSSS